SPDSGTAARSRDRRGRGGRAAARRRAARRAPPPAGSTPRRRRRGCPSGGRWAASGEHALRGYLLSTLDAIEAINTKDAMDTKDTKDRPYQGATEAQGTKRSYMRPNDTSRAVIACALNVHTALGAGMLESTICACLFYELTAAGLYVQHQVHLPVIYKEVMLPKAYRVDFIVEKCLIVE